MSASKLDVIYNYLLPLVGVVGGDNSINALIKRHLPHPEWTVVEQLASYAVSQGGASTQGVDYLYIAAGGGV